MHFDSCILRVKVGNVLFLLFPRGWSLMWNYLMFSCFQWWFDYSCGACGYPLNLSSSQRLVSSINTKALRKGKISFLCIDETRFKQVDEFKCAPFLHSNGSLGLHQLRTKLLCGKCGNVIGYGHSDSKEMKVSFQRNDVSDFNGGTPEHRKYCVKIKALQPYSDVECITPVPS